MTINSSSISQEIMKPNIKRKRSGSLNIKKAIKEPGALRKSLGIKKGKTIPASVLNKAAKSKNKKLRKRAIFAKTLKKLRKKRRS